jgi:hypothetical protein
MKRELWLPSIAWTLVLELFFAGLYEILCQPFGGTLFAVEIGHAVFVQDGEVIECLFPVVDWTGPFL